jgi:hypothetical protein
VKYKCIKMECPVCGNSGSLQLFYNNNGKITYSRVRHSKGKGKYTYCKIEKTDLETLKRQGLQLPSVLDQGQEGQRGQGAKLELHNPQLRSLKSSFSTNKLWAGSSARIEHHPPKVGVVGSNPTPPVEPQISKLLFR